MCKEVNMKYYISIDPGSSGAICALDELGNATFRDFKDGGIPGYVSWIRDIITTHGEPTIVAIEKVHAMPGQGVSSMFSFGQRVGELEGMLQTLGIGYIQVRPQEWQKLCGVKPKSGKKGIYKAIFTIYPDAELTGPRGGLIDGRCDALGITHYLRNKY